MIAAAAPMARPASGRSGRVGSWFVTGKRLEKAPFDLFYLVSSTHIAQRLLEPRDDAFVFRLFGYGDVSRIFRLNLERRLLDDAAAPRLVNEIIQISADPHDHIEALASQHINQLRLPRDKGLLEFVILVEALEIGRATNHSDVESVKILVSAYGVLGLDIRIERDRIIVSRRRLKKVHALFALFCLRDTSDNIDAAVLQHDEAARPRALNVVELQPGATGYLVQHQGIDTANRAILDDLVGWPLRIGHGKPF